MLFRDQKMTFMPNALLQQALNDFISNVPVDRLKQNLIKVLLVYLKNESPAGLPDFVNDHFIDLIFFFEFLDSIDEEMKQS